MPVSPDRPAALDFLLNPCSTTLVTGPEEQVSERVSSEVRRKCPKSRCNNGWWACIPG